MSRNILTQTILHIVDIYPYCEMLVIEIEVIIITNITHIKFIKVLDKLYRVTYISLSDMSISASECENPASVAAKDVFLLEELQEFHITLYNKHEKPNITDFSEWKKQHNCQ